MLIRSAISRSTNQHEPFIGTPTWQTLTITQNIPNYFPHC